MKDEECFAISFRYKSKNIAYEIGTTYTEKYKNYYPGVALELLNIRNILESDYEMADSCSAHNTVVDRIWPDDIVLCRTVIFENSLLGRAGKGIYRMLKKSRLIQQQQLFCD
jgi:hypothetical protein